MAARSDGNTQGRPRMGALLLVCALGLSALLVVEGAGSSWMPITDQPLPHFDKLLHFAAHAMLAIVTMTGVLLIGWPRRRRYLFAGFTALFVCTAAGVAAEIVQAGPGASHSRHADALDLLADAAGALAGILLVLAVARMRTRS